MEEAGTSVGDTALDAGGPGVLEVESDPGERVVVGMRSGASATSTTHSFTAQTSQNGYEYEALFTNSSENAMQNAATLTVSALDQSSNWSSYADMGSGFSGVNGNWTIPSLSCTSTTSYSSQWIGIDGATSSTVEQDGSEADCNGGAASYDAWYEMYGDGAVNNGNEVLLAPNSYPVYPGYGDDCSGKRREQCLDARDLRRW